MSIENNQAERTAGDPAHTLCAVEECLRVNEGSNWPGQDWRDRSPIIRRPPYQSDQALDQALLRVRAAAHSEVVLKHHRADNGSLTTIAAASRRSANQADIVNW